MKLFRTALLLAAALSLLCSVNAADEMDEAYERVIVRYTPGKEQEARAEILDAGATIEKALPGLNAFSVSMPRFGMRSIEGMPDLVQFEADVKRSPVDILTEDGEENAPQQGQTVPFGIPMVQADQLDDSKASENIMVCIIDSGYDQEHEDLPSAEGTNDEGTGYWHEDQNSHGTHVAGTIAAVDNDVGVVGVLPNSKVDIHIIKVFGARGWAYSSDLIDAVSRCEEAGLAKGKKVVINMSLGGAFASEIEKEAFQAAFDRGVFSIAAAGNNVRGHSYPASYPAVMSVAAVDQGKNLAWFSQKNDQVEISGPGVDVLSSTPSSRYGKKSGTSMACPHVVGVAALVWSHHPSCSAQDIRQALINTAEHLGAEGRNEEFGYGLVQALAAKEYLDSNPCGSSKGLRH